MNIVMFTNTFTPHVGGVARSVAAFSAQFRAMGHRVLVVAPVFPQTPREEPDVLRVPALQNFAGSDFSVALPVPGLLFERLMDFSPDLVHAHHPFLLGATALRVARRHSLPLVFTHHTLYERYTHYVPGDSETMKRFATHLSTGFANLCNEVFAPSESVRDLLLSRGVERPVTVVPTGVDVAAFAGGDKARGRTMTGIPPAAFVVGHVGRLAPEKNLPFLARAVARFLAKHPDAHFLVAGAGPEEADLRRQFERPGLAGRLHLMGVLERQQLADLYAAMDVFGFASSSETQGMVLTEAMAAGVPVVAIDAPGVREVVTERINGRLLPTASEAAFATALAWVLELPPDAREALVQGARATAERFSMAHTANLALSRYAALIGDPFTLSADAYDMWRMARRQLKAEWALVQGVAAAAGAALIPPEP